MKIQQKINDFQGWVKNNALSIIATIIASIALWSNNFRIENDFKAILIHEDLEDFFVLANEGNRDQILIDYFYGFKYQPEQEFIGILGANNAEPIIVKPGEKKILKPRWSLEHFIRTRTDTNYWFQDGPIDIKMKIDPETKKSHLLLEWHLNILTLMGM